MEYNHNKKDMETPNLSTIIDRGEHVNDGGTSKSSCNTEVVPRNDLWYKCDHCFQAFTSVEKLGTHVARYCFMIHLFDQNGFLRVFNTVQKESDLNSSPSQAKPLTACKDKSVTSMERISINAVEKKTQNTGNQENINNKGKQRGVCPICKKSFGHNLLSRHMRIHTGDMPYVCTKCSLSFSQSCSLTRHLLTHKKGEVLLDCKKCDNRYRTQRDLNRHLKLHEITGAYAVESLLKCKVCSSEYRTKRGLREHEKTHPELQNVDSKGGDLKDSVTSGTDEEDENIAEITKEQKRWTTKRLPTRLCKKKKNSAKSYKKTSGQEESEGEGDSDPEWKIDKAKSPCDNTEWKQKSAGGKPPAGASSEEKKQLDSVSLKSTNENSSSIVSASNDSKHVSMFRALIVTEPKKVDILSTQNNFLHSQKYDKASSLSEQRHGSIDNDLKLIHQNYNSSPADEQMDLEEQDKLSHPTETSSTSVNKDISNYRKPELSLSEAHKGKHTYKASSPLTQSEKVISLDDSSTEKDNDTPSGTEQTTANNDVNIFDPHATDPSSDAHHECENLDKCNHVKKYSIGENKQHCVLSSEKSILRKELTTEFNDIRRVPNVLTIPPAQQPLQHTPKAISSMQADTGAPSFGAMVPNFTLINLPVLVVTNPNPVQMQHPLQEIALNSLQGNIWKAPFVHSMNRIPPPVVSQLLNRQKQTTGIGASTMLQHQPKQNLLTWENSSQLTTDNKLAVAAQVNRPTVLCGKCNGSYPRSLHAYRMHMRTHHPSDTLSEGHQGNTTQRKQALQSKSCEPPEAEDSEPSLEGHPVKARKHKQALQLQSRKQAKFGDSQSSLEGHQVKTRKLKQASLEEYQGYTSKRKQAIQSKLCEPPRVEDSESSLEGHPVKSRKSKQALQLQSRRQPTVEDSDSSSEGHPGNTTKHKQALQSKSCEPPEVEDSEPSFERHKVRARKRKQAFQLQSRKHAKVEDSDSSSEGHQVRARKRKQALKLQSRKQATVEDLELSLKGHQDSESSLEGHQVRARKRKQALKLKSRKQSKVEDSESSLEGHQVKTWKRKQALQLQSRKLAKVETSESDTASESDTDLTSEPSTDAESICIDSDSDSSFMDEHVTASPRTEQCTEKGRDECNAVSRQRLTRSTVSKLKGLKSTVDYREKHEEHEDDILSDVSSEDLGEKVGEKQDFVRKVMTGSVEYCGEKGMQENVSNETEVIAHMKMKVARVRLVKLKLQDNVDHGTCFIKQEREGISTEYNQSERCELSPTTPETTFVATSYQSIRVKQEMMDFQSEIKDAVCHIKTNLSGADTRLQRHGINSSNTEFTLKSNSKSKELPSSIKSEPVDHEQDSCNHASAELPTLVMTSRNRCEGQESHSTIPGPAITSRVSIKNEQVTVQELAGRSLVRYPCVLPSDCNIVDSDTNCVAINVESETEVMDNNRNAVVVTAKRDVTSQPSPEPVDEYDLMNDKENDTSSNDDMKTEVIVNNTSQDAGTNHSNSVNLALPLIKPDGLTGEALSSFTHNPNIVIKTEPLEISTVDVSKHSVDHPQSIENISPCVPLIDHVRGSVGNAATWNDIGSEATITKVKREPLREEEPNDSSCSYYTHPCSTTELNPSGALSERMFLPKYEPISDDDECQMNNQTKPSIGSSDSAVLDHTSGHSNVCRLIPNIVSVAQGTKTPYLPPVEQNSTFTPNYQTEMGLQSLHSHGLSMSPSLAEIGIADPSGFSKSSGYNGAVGALRYNPSIENNVLYEQLLPIHRSNHSGNSLDLVPAHPQNHIDANINIPSNVSNRPAESRLCTTKVGSVHGLPAERFQTFYNSVGDSYVGSLAESSGLQQMFIGRPAGYQVQPSNSNPYGFHPNIANHVSNFENCERNVGYFASRNQTMNYQSGVKWPLHIQ
ncbi:uncharacterized protein [Apostichopus japonicus]|uniref:uncharacterized protein isoform X2 n=1 Tax=Stichopus japonicus TaxID=307972 RepID=UPI003AB2D80C